eukprot:TRINITY_DN7430_c0_g1_i1.p1 TRINITY_DN7430_c0_g1~~TRINITY_DN7430_c0_g1_i1.p1  ORF type:complete len:955 (-),score=147.02 TRINITY_DN7430_c0_g1_i1:27-2891(-)
MMKALSPSIANMVLLRPEWLVATTGTPDWSGGSWTDHPWMTLHSDHCVAINWDQLSMQALGTPPSASEETQPPTVLAIDPVDEAEQRAAFIKEYYSEFASASVVIRKAALSMRHYLHPVLSDPDHRVTLNLQRRISWLRTDVDAGKYIIEEYRKNPYAAFSIMITYVERALGDIVAWKTNGKERVPMRINDLLAMPVLKSLYGPDAVFLLRALIGPPTGINLRNLCWHGFFDTSDFHPSYVDFLLVLIASLHDILATSTGDADLPPGATKETDSALKAFLEWRHQLHTQPLLPEFKLSEKEQKIRGHWGQTTRKLDRISEKYDEHFAGWGPHTALFDAYLDSDSFDSILAILARSPFVKSQRLSIWTDAFTDWFVSRRQGDSDNKWRHLRALALILPQFEHAMRHLFVEANDLSSTRLLTAEPAQYLTTLDTVLEPVREHDGLGNKLYDELGENLMHALNDLFNWPLGPRLRIMVAHGVADINYLSNPVTDLLFATIIALCVKYDPTPDQAGTLTYRCSEYFKTYRPYYHPVSFLQRSAQVCYIQWQQLQTLQANLPQLRDEDEKSLPPPRPTPGVTPTGKPSAVVFAPPVPKPKAEPKEAKPDDSTATAASRPVPKTQPKQLLQQQQPAINRHVRKEQEATMSAEDRARIMEEKRKFQAEKKAAAKQKKEENRAKAAASVAATDSLVPSGASTSTAAPGSSDSNTTADCKAATAMAADLAAQVEAHLKTVLHIPSPLFSLASDPAVCGGSVACFGGFMGVKRHIHCSKAELCVVTALRDICLSAAELITEFMKNFHSLRAVVLSRKASKSKRSVYEKTCNSIEFFVDFIALFMLLVEDCIWTQHHNQQLLPAVTTPAPPTPSAQHNDADPGDPATSKVSDNEAGMEVYRFCSGLMSVMGRLCHLVSISALASVLEFFLCWAGGAQTSTQVLSQREIAKFSNQFATWRSLIQKP